MRDVVLKQVYPPIPDRRWDWCAWHDGEEEDTHHTGWGPTPEQALADLARIDQERAEEEDESDDR
jgi:hypothetical protein